jgi:hypothetical protein
MVNEVENESGLEEKKRRREEEVESRCQGAGIGK